MPTCRQTPGTQLEVRRNTSKTSKKHATAVVDGSCARHKERSDEKRPQDPESTPSSRSIHSRTKIARPRVVAPTGTTTLSRSWTATISTATAELHSFCALQSGHLSLHNNKRMTTMPKTVPVKVHSLLHSVHCEYQDLQAAGCPPFCR